MQCKRDTHISTSAYTWQRIANQHIQYPHSTNVRTLENHSRWAGLHRANNGCLVTQRVIAHSLQRNISFVWSDDSQKFTLVSDCQGIETHIILSLSFPPKSDIVKQIQ